LINLLLKKIYYNNKNFHGGKMELTKITPRRHKRIFSIISGFLVGLFIMILFNISGNGPDKFIILFNNTGFFAINTLTHYLTSILLFTSALITAGMVTSFLLSEAKRNSILGGLTGIILIFVIMLISYSYGSIYFPTSSQVMAILGPASIPLVFVTYAIPCAMIGFIFGYLGSFLTEKIYYNPIAI
jgi:hypothetical protein